MTQKKERGPTYDEGLGVVDVNLGRSRAEGTGVAGHTGNAADEGDGHGAIYLSGSAQRSVQSSAKHFGKKVEADLGASHCRRSYLSQPDCTLRPGACCKCWHGAQIAHRTMHKRTHTHATRALVTLTPPTQTLLAATPWQICSNCWPSQQGLALTRPKYCWPGTAYGCSSIVRLSLPCARAWLLLLARRTSTRLLLASGATQ